MEYTPLHQITVCWDDMTSTVLDLEELSLSKMHLLLKETFKALATFCKDEHIPKKICNVLLSMEDFLEFASMMERNETGEGYYHCLEFRIIISALRAGFFSGSLACKYPKLVTTLFIDKPLVLDFEKDSLEDYFNLVNPK